MECRTLEITIQYAEDLSKVNLISKMDVYVVVSISGGDESSRQKTKTEVSRGGGANPTWSFPMKFVVEEAALLQNRLMLDFTIKCERALGDRVIGEVHVPVKELLDFPAKIRGGATTAAKNFVSYQVKKPGAKPKGKLTFSYQFRGKTATSAAQPPPPPPPAQHGKSTIAYPVVDPTPPYPAAALGLYPPTVPPQLLRSPYFVGGLYPPVYIPDGGLIRQEWSPLPPLPAEGYFGHPPPVMQLAPDWWIVDWRHDARCSGF